MKVLCIDGGGIRGLIPALVLDEIERRTGRPTAEMVDLVAGTSTGGLLACGLTRADDAGRPRYTAAELAEIYLTDGPAIFAHDPVKAVTSAGGLLDEKYDAAALEGTLRRYLGEDPLSAALRDVLITAYDIERRAAFFFRSARARRDPAYDFTLAAASRATSAAPSYFEPARVTDAAGAATYALVDGGVFAVNPSLCAYADLVQAGGIDHLTVMLSLGTGSATTPIPYQEARSWGQLEWARPILDIVFDGVADTTEFEAAAVMGDRYIRLQTELREASSEFDDASAENLAALRREAERLIAEQSATIDRACALLTT
ncbi:MAG TPA: patatin-like phospholipase family protein [Solirubrobacteraceae bacterium]|nr:patatin-like phospholipase family protein [Solirubrobacteraceae bacterium]